MLTFTWAAPTNCSTLTPTNTRVVTATNTHGPTNTPMPTGTHFHSTPAPTICAANYHIVQTENVSPVAGTDLVTGSQCDDCIFNISLPFSYSLYGQAHSN